MKKNCVFTIVAKNYIGLAETLGNSIKKYNSDTDFFVIVSDEIPNNIDIPNNIIIAKEVLQINPKTWIECSFKYNVTEFATFIKPKSFEYLFSKGYENLIYLDPDILTFSSLTEIIKQLDLTPIIVSPHIMTIQETEYTGDYPENIFLGMGIFNLGFLAIKKSVETYILLKWWSRVLENDCFMDSQKYTATDQKWMDYLSIFFQQDKIHISRDLGIDVAPWNFYERKIVNENGQLFVINRIGNHNKKDILKFVHFSGYKYLKIMEGIFDQSKLLHKYEDIEVLFQLYQVELKKSKADSFLSLSYTYNTFSNGVSITKFIRRLYRRTLIENINFDYPFDSTQKFYKLLIKKKLLIIDNNINKGQVSNSTNKNSRTIKIIDKILVLAKNILGIKRYSKLCSFLSQRLKPENQLFLLGFYNYDNYK